MKIKQLTSLSINREIMKEVIIIGGGIGGAATALALIRAGLEPMVYERTKELREVGAGIALWANATHILKNLGLLEEAMRVGYLTTNYQFNSQFGKELVNVRLIALSYPLSEFIVPNCISYCGAMYRVRNSFWEKLLSDLSAKVIRFMPILLQV
jgi:hypothetical protein